MDGDKAKVIKKTCSSLSFSDNTCGNQTVCFLHSNFGAKTILQLSSHLNLILIASIAMIAVH